MATVTFVKAFESNYHWLIIDRNSCVVVDPGDAKPVIDFIEKNQLNLTHILITHHHFDHIDGIADLKNRYNPQTVGIPTDRTGPLDVVVSDGDTVELNEIGASLKVMETPGHTQVGASYYNDDWVFVGDTLFAGGCGRLLEGTAEALFHSLERLMQLPPNTQVFCAHEYTEANLRFALTVDPDNEALKQRYSAVLEKRAKNEPTVPSTILDEQTTNPFCRCDKIKLLDCPTPLETFTRIRKMKDEF